eukprot:CAMPEP_0177659900 /NCGR_PEP_ID=MMETSP0447-20121125/17704_1 /TAXON_ID=0 /ORGANISM="Stygamoeba regulata, Strain BSH-02190019" /LENGTH=156 /DNA_ID=CAMNT_0019164831 /DNA_START=43 /DNA_END=513 /DNA_ORIENTATION=+
MKAVFVLALCLCAVVYAVETIENPDLDVNELKAKTKSNDCTTAAATYNSFYTSCMKTAYSTSDNICSTECAQYLCDFQNQAAACSADDSTPSTIQTSLMKGSRDMVSKYQSHCADWQFWINCQTPSSTKTAKNGAAQTVGAMAALATGACVAAALL